MARRITKLVLAVFFLAAGILHFIRGELFAQIVLPFLPFPLAIVWATGVMEIGFAVLLFSGRHLPLTGKLLALYLLAVLPANIHMALKEITFGNAALTPTVLWARVALQFPLIALVLWTTHERQRAS